MKSKNKRKQKFQALGKFIKDEAKKEEDEKGKIQKQQDQKAKIEANIKRTQKRHSNLAIKVMRKSFKKNFN